ncbi:GPI inositol-deacylase [Geodia barretti]|uniref:GPI inositol-deacylase n=1 Tax=Geodia barretti TaxID=519541 RepID=A0AA35QTP1_GEOBA|nr:GPI inositol-deacylase [Geodia barretti]
MKSKRSQNAVILGYLQALWLPFLVCGLLAASAVDLVPRLTHSDCEMTWMFSWPQYQRLNLSLELREAYPQYGLHLYRENRNREEPLLDAAPLRLRGLPALFIPGNAGSHKQVRSSASIALQMHRHEFPRLRHFDFFTVDLNEEFSGLFGGVLLRQTQFVAASIRHILSLYPSSPSRPSSVLIVAHSMGGVVAQALFTLPNFPSSLVSTIITLSSPLARPVVTFDPSLMEFYTRISEVWYNDREGGVARNVTLVSVSGGDSDVQVPFHLTIPSSHPHQTHTPTIGSPAVPRNWVPADHRAVVWWVNYIIITSFPSQVSQATTGTQ